MHQIVGRGGGGERGGVGSTLSRKDVEWNSGAKEDKVVPYISRWEMGDVRVSTIVKRCATDAAFFTFLGVAATFCEYRPRMLDETTSLEGSI